MLINFSLDIIFWLILIQKVHEPVFDSPVVLTICELAYIAH